MADFANRLIVRGALLVAALVWTAGAVGAQPPLPTPPPGPAPLPAPTPPSGPFPSSPSLSPPVKLPFEVVITAPKEVTARHPLAIQVQVKNLSEKSFAHVQLATLFEPREPGVLSEYHRAALFALCELTGRDTAPTAAAWRKLLGL